MSPNDLPGVHYAPCASKSAQTAKLSFIARILLEKLSIAQRCSFDHALDVSIIGQSKQFHIDNDPIFLHNPFPNSDDLPIVYDYRSENPVARNHPGKFFRGKRSAPLFVTENDFIESRQQIDRLRIDLRRWRVIWKPVGLPINCFRSEVGLHHFQCASRHPLWPALTTSLNLAMWPDRGWNNTFWPGSPGLLPSPRFSASQLALPAAHKFVCHS